MKKTLYLLLLGTWFFVSHTYAQDVGDPLYKRYARTQKKYTITQQPLQLLFNWAWRFDFEMRLGNGPGWLQLGPALYLCTKDRDNPDYYYYYDRNDYHGDFFVREPFSKLRGYGLDVNYKRYVNPKRSLYLAGGLSYTRFNVGYWGQAWKEYIEDGLQYHEYGIGYHTQHINRMGINTYFGHQIASRHAFLADIFVGLAYRHSFSEKEKPPFNDNAFSYGYSGVVFMTGVKLGIGIR